MKKKKNVSSFTRFTIFLGTADLNRFWRYYYSVPVYINTADARRRLRCLDRFDVLRAAAAVRFVACSGTCGTCVRTSKYDTKNMYEVLRMSYVLRIKYIPGMYDFVRVRLPPVIHTYTLVHVLCVCCTSSTPSPPCWFRHKRLWLQNYDRDITLLILLSCYHVKYCCTNLL